MVADEGDHLLELVEQMIYAELAKEKAIEALKVMG